jgi:NAD(P)-dependent dehydrogenase (short-subunit alcohol dehydrogenase family)
MSSVNGKVVLITGGARGVGAEVARQLHRKGAELVVTDIDQTPLHEADWLPAPPGPSLVVLRLYWPKPEALDSGLQAPAPVKA